MDERLSVKERRSRCLQGLKSEFRAFPTVRDSLVKEAYKFGGGATGVDQLERWISHMDLPMLVAERSEDPFDILELKAFCKRYRLGQDWTNVLALRLGVDPDEQPRLEVRMFEHEGTQFPRVTLHFGTAQRYVYLEYSMQTEHRLLADFPQRGVRLENGYVCVSDEFPMGSLRIGTLVH